jgi:CRP-like cAMP-binding protein
MPVDAVEALAKVPIFSGLDSKYLTRLAADFSERSFPPGWTIVQEGDERSLSFFVIADGRARVVVGGEEVAELGPGDHFGEIALIGDGVRSATVTTETDLACFAMDAWVFRTLVQKDPEIAWELLRHLVRLVTSSSSAIGVR